MKDETGKKNYNFSQTPDLSLSLFLIVSFLSLSLSLSLCLSLPLNHHIFYSLLISLSQFLCLTLTITIPLFFLLYLSTTSNIPIFWCLSSSSSSARSCSPSSSTAIYFQNNHSGTICESLHNDSGQRVAFSSSKKPILVQSASPISKPLPSHTEIDSAMEINENQISETKRSNKKTRYWKKNNNWYLIN